MRRSRFLAVVVLAVGALLVACGPVDEGLPVSRTASQLGSGDPCGEPCRGVVDLEFDYVNHRIAFGTQDKKVAGARIDPATGDMVPGSYTVLENSGDFTLSCAGAPFGNGPEWALSRRGSELYYTYNMTTPATMLGTARVIEDGISRPVELQDRSCAIASYWPNDDVPALAYIKGNLEAIYTLAEEGAEEIPIPEMYFGLAAGAAPARHVPGLREVVMETLVDPGDPNAGIRITRKAPLTGQSEHIATYWPPDEVYGIGVVRRGDGAHYFYVNVNLQRFDVYLSTGWGKYEKKTSLRPPQLPGNVQLTDHENFPWKGESYLTMIAQAGDYREIWLAKAEAGADPSKYRRLTDPGKLSDPEPLPLTSTVAVYFIERVGATNFLRRAWTDL